jgi:hypothetical protein
MTARLIIGYCDRRHAESESELSLLSCSILKWVIITARFRGVKVLVAIRLGGSGTEECSRRKIS